MPDSNPDIRVENPGMKCFIPAFLFAFSGLVIPLKIFSQTTAITLKGTIRDQESQLPLSYTSIGLPDKPLGCISDSVGGFYLTLGSENLNDSLRITRIGYQSSMVAVRDLVKKNDSIIILLMRVDVVLR